MMYFYVLVDKATIMEGNYPMHNNNNITTIVAHPTPGRSKESVTQPEYLVAQPKQQTDDLYMSPRRNLKNHGKMAYKEKRQNKAVISLRNTEPLLQNCPNHCATSRKRN
jgi:hypothetical protein